MKNDTDSTSSFALFLCLEQFFHVVCRQEGAARENGRFPLSLVLPYQHDEGARADEIVGSVDGVLTRVALASGRWP